MSESDGDHTLIDLANKSPPRRTGSRNSRRSQFEEEELERQNSANDPLREEPEKMRLGKTIRNAKQACTRCANSLARLKEEAEELIAEKVEIDPNDRKTKKFLLNRIRKFW